MNKSKQLKPNIVVLGGGTGNFTVLTGLKKYSADLSAIVTMSDDGGSTGILRDELGVLPPGDIRQCLVALSNSDELMRKLMNYRFSSGTLKGHSFGNLFLSALEITTGNFENAIEAASEILRIEGRVIPSTLDNVQLIAHLKNGKTVRGEHTIEYQDLSELKDIVLEPKAKANPKALEIIKKADLIVISPGDFYQSTVPNLLVTGIPETIVKSRAKKVYVCNLMTKPGHTNDYFVGDFTEEIEKYLGEKLDYIIYNDKQPDPVLIKQYAEEGELPVEVNKNLSKKRFIEGDLLSKKFAKPIKGDPIQRSLIRHDPDKLAKLILSLV